MSVAAAPSPAFDPGAIRLTLSVAGGIVVAVAVAARRPLALASAFRGRDVETVAAAVGALNGVCGGSHRTAMRLAASAALGAGPGADERSGQVLALAGERIAEHARSLFGSTAPDIEAMRTVQTIGRAIGHGAPVEAGLVARLGAALGRLGLGVEAGDRPAGCKVDALRAADDAAVIAALGHDAGYAAAPSLPDRVPETGAAARSGVSAADPAAAAWARRREIARALALLAGGRQAALAAADDWFACGRIDETTGFAAVESPRGRLHYRLGIFADRRLADARVVAPTEWNFHPAGPAARSLVGMAVAGDDLAPVVARVAAFDPCVAFTVSLGEVQHA